MPTLASHNQQQQPPMSASMAAPPAPQTHQFGELLGGFTLHSTSTTGTTPTAAPTGMPTATGQQPQQTNGTAALEAELLAAQGK